ncbi:MAG: GGDEF domain-containing protein [Bacteroidales bacterium]|nr:GGDEF domain-containing protein [Bacteroidales bacterium]MCM1416011.1 GGDEF domain-containing protein [bacterium]MCM1423823.1 GGDEF domain-containing protein [bacterium]
MKQLLRRLLAVKDPQGRKGGRVYGPGERDALTGVANKKAFLRIVAEALAGGQKSGCLVLVDVDHMREINERCGTETGDRVLRAAAKTLLENFRSVDAVGRLEEDLFALWIEGMSPEHVGGIRRRIAVVNDKLLHADGDLPTVTLSAGAALGEAGESWQELYLQAQKVLQRVKEGGRCGCEIGNGEQRIYTG